MIPVSSCDLKIYGVPRVEKFQHNSGLVFQQVILEWNVVSANHVDIFLKKPSTDDNLISSRVIQGQIEIPVDESGDYTVTLFADNQGQCEVSVSKSFLVVF